MFIDIFESLCLSKHVSMNKACIEIGISRTSTAKWKKGSTPNGQTLAKIADYFSVSVDYLLTSNEAHLQKPEVSETEALQNENAALKAKVKELTNTVTVSQTEITMLKNKISELTAKNDLLRIKLEYEQKIGAIHDFYTNRK